MSNFEELIDKYFDSLNETDDARRRGLIEEVWAEEGKFVSPIGEVTGYAAIAAQVRGFQKQFPETEVRRTSEIEVLHGKYLRFTFKAAQSDGGAFISGVDFAVIDDGKLSLVAGFFDSALNQTNQSTRKRSNKI